MLPIAYPVTASSLDLFLISSYLVSSSLLPPWHPISLPRCPFSPARFLPLTLRLNPPRRSSSPGKAASACAAGTSAKRKATDHLTPDVVGIHNGDDCVKADAGLRHEGGQEGEDRASKPHWGTDKAQAASIRANKGNRGGEGEGVVDLPLCLPPRAYVPLPRSLALLPPSPPLTAVPAAKGGSNLELGVRPQRCRHGPRICEAFEGRRE